MPTSSNRYWDSFNMMESEKALEDYLFSLATKKKTNPLNGCKIKWVKRQVRLGSWGIVDLMMEGEDGFLYIIELKNTRFRTKYLFQGMKYLACLNVGFDDCDHHSVSILCMGGELSESDYHILQAVKGLELYIHKGFMEGVKQVYDGCGYDEARTALLAAGISTN